MHIASEDCCLCVMLMCLCVFCMRQVADLSARVQGYEEGSVDKHAVKRLETKIRDLESRLELEQSQRQRSEVCANSVSF